MRRPRLIRAACLAVLVSGCGGGGPAGREAPAPALDPATELDVRGALDDAMQEDDAASERGRDRLIQIGPGAVPVLLEALRADQALTQRRPAAALKAERLRRLKLALILGEIRDRRAVPALLEYYDGGTFARALERITGQALGDDLEAWREWYVDQPPASADEIAQALRQFRRQGTAERLQTLQGLAQAVRPRTGAAVLEPLQDAAGFWEHRQVQLMNARELDDRRAARALLAEAFQDPDPNVCHYARLVAVQMGHMAVQPLRPLARGGPVEMRARVIRTLGEIGSPRALPELAAAVADPHPDLRRLAAQALGLACGAAAADPLERQLAREEDPEVRSALLAALVMAGQTRRFDDLVAGLQGDGEDRRRATVHLEGLARRAYTLAAQEVAHLRLPVSQESWNDYWQKRNPGADPARWREWWTGARSMFERRPPHPVQGDPP